MHRLHFMSHAAFWWLTVILLSILAILWLSSLVHDQTRSAAPLTASAAQAPAVQQRGSFAGSWNVYLYQSPTMPPSQPTWLKITVSGNEAVSFEKVGSTWMEGCRGPLTESGQVWNARKKVGSVTVMHFDNVRLSPDGGRFEGKWSGAAPHNYPLIGVRIR